MNKPRTSLRLNDNAKSCQEAMYSRRSVTDARAEQQRQRMVTRGQAVRTHTAALCSACRTLRQELAEQCGQLDSAMRCVTHELGGVITERFRVHHAPTSKGPSGWPLSFHDLLERLDVNPASVPQNELVAAIRLFAEENRMLCEKAPAMAAKAMMCERNLRTTAENIKVRLAGVERGNEQRSVIAKHAQSLSQLGDRLAAAYNTVLSEMADLEAQRDQLQSNLASTREQIKAQSASAPSRSAPTKVDAALVGEGSLSLSFGAVNVEKAKALASVDAEEVIGRIYKRHDAWQTMWDAVSEQQRQRDEAALLRQASDRMRHGGICRASLGRGGGKQDDVIRSPVPVPPKAAAPAPVSPHSLLSPVSFVDDASQPLDIRALFETSSRSRSNSGSPVLSVNLRRVLTT